MFRQSSILLVCLAITLAIDSDPMCLSRYDYDYKVLQQLVTLEQQQKDLKELIGIQEKYFQQKLSSFEKQQNDLKEVTDKQEQTIQYQEQVIQEMNSTYRGTVNTLEQNLSNLMTGSGSTYVRWGRTMCPGNGTEVVYEGYVGGSSYLDSGAAVNYICLPTDPLWGEYDNYLHNSAPVSGAEYQIFGSQSNLLFKKTLLDHDVPCVVCRSNRASVVMIPARNACYGGWTLEYTGYLTGGHRTHTAASEFVCLDGDPEVIPGSQADLNGILFHVAEASCGSLKCPPYVNGRELTCAVCTK